MNRFWLAAAMVALPALIGWELQDAGAPEPEPAAHSTRPAPRPSVKDEGEGDAAGEAWAATAVERPLFREDRRPPKAAAEPARGERRPRLTGVIVGPSGRTAIFRVGDDPKPVIVREGGRVGDLTVRSIEPGRAVVEARGALTNVVPSFTEDPARPRR